MLFTFCSFLVYTTYFPGCKDCEGIKRGFCRNEPCSAQNRILLDLLTYEYYSKVMLASCLRFNLNILILVKCQTLQLQIYFINQIYLTYIKDIINADLKGTKSDVNILIKLDELKYTYISFCIINK